MKKLLLIILLFFCLIIPSCETYPEAFMPKTLSVEDSTKTNPNIIIVIDTTENIILDTIYIDISI